MRRWNGLLEEYKEWLPVNENTPMITLQEGNTPLIHLENLSKEWGVNVYVKTEGANPTVLPGFSGNALDLNRNDV